MTFKKMENQNSTIDLSHISENKTKIADIGVPTQSGNHAYWLVVGVSFSLACFFYYVFFKNEAQKNNPQIVARPAMSDWQPIKNK
jgi:hypothetical protein